MGNVIIGGVTHTVYGDRTGAGSLAEYANASLAYASLFAATSDDDQARAMVEATRVIDRAPWQGTKTSGVQALAFPRTGVVYPDGTAVDPNTIPAEVIAGAYELALAGLADVTLFTEVSTAKNIKRMEAKGVGLEYFGPTAGARWPGRVSELLAQFLASSLAGSSSDSGSFAAGVDGCSQFDPCDEFGLSGPG